MDKKELYAMWEMSIGGVGGVSPTNSVAGGAIAGLPPEEYKIEDIEKLREDRLDLYEEKEKILQFNSDLDN